MATRPQMSPASISGGHLKLQQAGDIGRHGIGFLLALAGVLFQNWSLDNDIWFILNGGRYVVEHGIPHTEPFTMHEGMHFVLEQWLTGVLFWEVYESSGPVGLLHLVFAVGCILLCAYYLLCMRVSGGNRQASILMTMMAGVMTYPFFLVSRPQILSTLLFVVEVFLLESYVRTRQRKWLLPLPLLSVLLVNLHAALWPMLLILLLPFLAAGAAERWELLTSALAHSRFPLRPLLLAAAGIFLAGFLNPYGWEAMSFVFYSYDPEIHGRINELHPVTIYGIFGKCFFLWLLLLIVIISRKTIPLQYVFLTAGTALMSLFALRSLFLFFFLGTLPMVYAARGWKSELIAGRQGMGSPWRLLPFALLCLVVGYRAFRMGSVGDIPLGPACLFGMLALFLILYLFCHVEEGKRFSLRIPGLRLKFASILLSLLMFFIFSICHFLLRSEDYGETYKPAMDCLLEQCPSEDILLWTGFNSGAYPEFRGIRCYVDARPEVFLPSNTHQEHNVIKEYYDLVDGNIYYRDFFRQHMFTHVLTVKGDGIVHAMLPHDDGFRLLYEQKDEDGDVICRLYEAEERKRNGNAEPDSN